MEKKNLNPIDVKIGQNIRQRRMAKGMGLSDIGDHLTKAITPTAVGWYETGINRVAASTLVEISRILGCRVSDLFDGIEPILKAHETKDAEFLGDYAPLNNAEVQSAMRNMTSAIVKAMAVNLVRK